MPEETVFSKILTGEIPSHEVYSDDDVYAFRDINPQAPVHVVLIPRKPIPKLTDATEADTALMGKFLLAANKVAEREGIDKNGFRCILNCGPAAGQEVNHIHMHILGGRRMGWPPG